MSHLWVVLDTNLIIDTRGDPADADLQVLLTARDTIDFSIAVAEVSILEFVEPRVEMARTTGMQVIESRAAINDSASTLLARFQRLVERSDADPASVESLESILSEYERVLTTRLGTWIDYTIPAPALDAKEFLKRKAARRAPFSNNKGDRSVADLLIWKSILDLRTKADQPIVLLTKDKDFGGHDRLHVDLVEDLRRLGHATESVVKTQSVTEFLQQVWDDSTSTSSKALSEPDSIRLEKLIAPEIEASYRTMIRNAVLLGDLPRMHRCNGQDELLESRIHDLTEIVSPRVTRGVRISAGQASLLVDVTAVIEIVNPWEQIDREIAEEVAAEEEEDDFDEEVRNRDFTRMRAVVDARFRVICNVASPEIRSVKLLEQWADGEWEDPSPMFCENVSEYLVEQHERRRKTARDRNLRRHPLNR